MPAKEAVVMIRDSYNPAFLSADRKRNRFMPGSPRAVLMTRPILWLLLLSMLAIPAAAQSPDAAGAERTLSPFFFVRSDDPTVDRLPLLSTTAEVTIAGVIADVVVTQTYKNDGTRPIEALYVFPGSTRAAVYGMKMTIEDRVLIAEIREREQARQVYETAKQEGKSASLLEQQRPNVFEMNVANIMPGDSIAVELRYTELLVPHDGVYEFVYPTVVGPRYSNKSAAAAPPSEQWVESPYQHEGEVPLSTFRIRVRLAAGLPIQEIGCPSHRTITSYNGADAATVELVPEERNGGNRDYILHYRLDGGRIETGLLLAPGADENFFLLMVQPPRRVEPADVPPREYIFIMDVSGSMTGFPIETSKTLVRNLLTRLRPIDSFNVLFFSGGNWVLSPQSLSATQENIKYALEQVGKQQGGGGTELLPALRTALGLPRAEEASRTIVIATDGYVNVEAEAFDVIRNNLGNANLFAFGIGSSVNRHIIEGLAYVGMGEPFIVTKPEEAAATATRFLRYVESPVLTRVRLEYIGFDAYDAQPNAVPDVLAQRPIVVFGKWRGAPRGAIAITGRTAAGPFQQLIEVADARTSPSDSALRYLWARHRIKMLADYAPPVPWGENKAANQIREVTQLGLKYNLLTPYTSFVAVDHVVRSNGLPEKVKQPLALPQGVTDHALSGGLVQEIKVILSPADAEFGRGVGQVQIVTRTGGSSYHGSVVYNLQNDALNSNNFNSYNFANNSINEHNYTASFSGPIVKQKTFFFVNWSQTIANNRQEATPVVLTKCARKGVFRYFSGWDNRNAASGMNAASAFGSVPYRAVVNAAGVPLAKGLVPDEHAITLQPDGVTESSLQFQSVFGRLNQTALGLLAQDPIDCSKYDPYKDPGVANYWETGTSSPGLRQLDPITVPRFSSVMPLPNNYSMATGTYSNNGGDGLNTAVNKWTRENAGNGTSRDTQKNRKSVSVNINHNFSERHRMTGTYVMEVAGGSDATRLWKDAGSEGTSSRSPQKYEFSITSTLKATMLNEARVGFARTVSHSYSPMNAPENGDKARELLRYLTPTENFPNYPNLPLIVGLGAEKSTDPNRGQDPTTIAFSPEGSGMSLINYGNPSSHPYGAQNGSLPATTTGTDHRWTVNDTLTWMKGAHSFKAGGEIRLTRSRQDTDGSIGIANSALTSPVVFGGFTDRSIPLWNYPSTLGLVGTRSYLSRTGGGVTNNSTGTVSSMIDLLTYMSGSISNIRQHYFVNNASDKSWNDAIGKGETFRITDMRRKEFSLFANDEWRIRSNFSFNLGMRWEYYGAPYLANGLTSGLEGGPAALFGVTGRDIGAWMPAHTAQLDDSYLTREVFIGPNSPNPNQRLYKADYNNFAPAAGFSWQIPWFGKGKTVLRGGYQMSYQPIAAAANSGSGSLMATDLGMAYTHYYRGEAAIPYLDVADLAGLVPTSNHMDPAIVPLDTMKLRNHGVSFTAYDYNVASPYSQSVNLSLMRTIANNVTVDIRYVSTLARKGIGSINLNTPNFISNGLLDALNEVRRGNNPELFDKMFGGIQFAQIGDTAAVGSSPTALKGGDILRRKWAAPLANGDYASIATALADLNYDKAALTASGAAALINQNLPDILPGEQGSVLRYANSRYPGMFPENYILANPQLSTAMLRGNLIHSNYHSMQAQVMIRPTGGISFTSTYTLAKNLADQPGAGSRDAGNWTDPLNRTMDYRLSYTPKHQWNTYGYVDLPFGPNGFFFRNVQNGIVKQMIEGWQLSWNMSMQSGSPQQVSSGANHLYNNATLMDLVGPKELAPRSSGLDWPSGSAAGYYYGNGNNARYVIAPDPQCSDANLIGGNGYGYYGETPLRQSCSLSALYLRNPDGSRGRIILQNPLPGHQGTFAEYISGVGSFSINSAMGKNIPLAGEKSINIRIDCNNIMNHPLPVNPAFAVSSNVFGAGFGSVNAKTGNRTFKGSITFKY
jgi:Ca-activated chloride channel homolog